MGKKHIEDWRALNGHFEYIAATFEDGLRPLFLLLLHCEERTLGAKPHGLYLIVNAQSA